jgi:hypothetical protein
MPVVIVRYAETPPSDERLRTELALTGDYTYIVATAALEDAREALAPSHQMDDEGNPALVFHKALRHFLASRLLTRAEERVALQRAMSRVAQGDAQREQQLRRDVFTWSEAIGDLAARGHSLDAGISPELQAQLVHQEIGALLRDLQREYREAQRQAGKRTFEEAAFAYLGTDYRPTSRVVLEGFTFLTPLQQHFVRTCLARGATVYFVHPYRDAQRRGFAVMDRTYGPFQAGAQERVLDTQSASSGNALGRLQRGLFTAAPSPVPPATDGRVTLEAHAHRHTEVTRCVEQIHQYLGQGILPEQIAVVTRNAAEFQTLLQEVAGLRGLDVTIGVPPRMLLLTPLGRFVLALYEVWRDGALQLDAEHLEAILASGWLGTAAQESVDPFSAVRVQMFNQCGTRAQWNEALERLHRLVAPQRLQGSRMPAASVNAATVSLWADGIERVETLCRQLFSGGERSIGAHVERLLNELDRLLPEQTMRQTEREVLGRIREVLLRLSESTSLAMRAAEFGDVLNSLVREYEQGQSEDAQEGAQQPGRVWITTPEGIDGYQKDYVFFLGVDNQRVPRAFVEPWPFYVPDIGEHQERERYLFLAVARAARQHLHLSFARADEGGVYRPSPYLEQVSDLLGVPITDVAAPPALSPTVAASRRSVGRARRSTYKLAEIAHFALCPWRYKLERLSPSARQYRAEYQVILFAQAYWTNRALARMVDCEFPSGQDLLDSFHAVVDEKEEEVRKQFPALRPLHFATMRLHVRRALDYAAEKAGDRPVSVRKGPSFEFEIPDGDRTVHVTAAIPHVVERGIAQYPLLDDIMISEWLLPANGSNTDRQPSILDGIPVFTNQYAAVQWWQETLRAGFFWQRARNSPSAPERFREDARTHYESAVQGIQDLLPHIEAGHYPKNPGDHCRLCPVRGDCLGLDP